MPDPVSLDTSDLPQQPQAETRKGVPWWLWPQVVSLDAPIVAVLWMAALGRSHYLNLPSAFFWALGLATWLVYLVDRTSDAESGRLPKPLSTRHAFCLRRRRYIWWGAVPLLALALGWVALSELPIALLPQGLAVAMLAALYLAVFATKPRSWQHRLLVLLAMAVALMFVQRLPGYPFAWWRFAASVVVSVLFFQLLRGRSGGPGLLRNYKEPLAALLFTLGCAAGVHFWTPPEHGILCRETLLLWALFALNLWGISDAERRQGSKATASATPRYMQVGMALALVIACQIFQTASFSSMVLIHCIQVSALLLGALHLAVHRLRVENYHFLADAALVVPLPLLFRLL